MPFECAAALILVLAAFTFSFAGFGFPWVALPLLALVMPVREAVIFHYPFVLGLVLYHAWRFRGHLNWRGHWFLLAGAAMGMPLGVWVLVQMPETDLKKGLALFVALSVLALSSDWTKRQAARLAKIPWVGALTGLLSGWLQGAYAVGGPPAVLYIMASGADPKEVKGFLGVYFTFITVVSAGLLLASGMFTLHWLKMSLYFSPAVIGGALLGAWAFNRAPSLWFRRIVFGLLLATSITLWVWS